MTNKSALQYTIFCLFSLSVLLTGTLKGQDFMDLPGFLKIMGASEKQYGFSLLEGRITEAADPSNINLNNYFLVDSLDRRLIKPYLLSREAMELQEFGLEAMLLEEPDSAIVFYKEVLDVYPDYSPAITGLGQAWEQKGNYPEAISHFRRAIDINSIDYVAHWSLGRIYQKTGNSDSALHYLLHAMVLNRNVTQIKRDIQKTLSSEGMNFSDWMFVPQYELKLVNRNVDISYNAAWMGYAVCQAVWTYEPGFASSRNINGDIGMFRERECLSCLITSMQADKAEAAKDVALKWFKVALQEKMTLEFILFEIVLPAKPDMAYFLDETRMSRMKEYIIKTRFQTSE